MRQKAHWMRGWTLFTIGLLLTYASGLAAVARGTEMRIRLNDSLSSNDSRVGDKFTATVVSPGEFEGATISGHISDLKKSGSLKGQTRMRLKFDRIRFSNQSTSRLSADIVQVYESGTENVKKTDEEGSVESGKQSTEALKRGAIGAAAGAIIGGLTGGGKGATIGLLVGGAAGVGSLAVTGKQELKLESGTEMLIRTL